MADRLQELERRYAAEPTSRIFLQLAEEYRRLGTRDKALLVLEQGMKHHGAWLAAQVALGRCLVETGRHADAARALEGVVRRDPTQLVAYRLLVECYLATREIDLATDRLTVYRELNPQDPVIGQLEGRIRGAGVAPPPALQPSGPLATHPGTAAPRVPPGSASRPPSAGLPAPRAKEPAPAPRPMPELPPLPAIAPPATAAPAPVPHIPWPELALGPPAEPEQPEVAPLEWFTTPPTRFEPGHAVAPPPPLGVKRLEPSPAAPPPQGPVPEPRGGAVSIAAAPEPRASDEEPTMSLPIQLPPLPRPAAAAVSLQPLAAERDPEVEAWSVPVAGAPHPVEDGDPGPTLHVPAFELPRPDLAALYAVTCRPLVGPRPRVPASKNGDRRTTLAPSTEGDGARPPVTVVTVVTVDPEAVTPTLGLLYLAQGHVEEAEQVLHQVLLHDPGNQSALRALASIARQSEPPAGLAAREFPDPGSSVEDEGAAPANELEPLPQFDHDGASFATEEGWATDAELSGADVFAAPGDDGSGGAPRLERGPRATEGAAHRPLGLTERKAVMLRNYLQRLRRNTASNAP